MKLRLGHIGNRSGSCHRDCVGALDGPRIDIACAVPRGPLRPHHGPRPRWAAEPPNSGSPQAREGSSHHPAGRYYAGAGRQPHPAGQRGDHDPDNNGGPSDGDGNL